jgi:hypothetical protein
MPATRTNDKATLFITCPFSCLRLYSVGMPPTPLQTPSLQRPVRSVNFREFFNFGCKQPSLKRQQVLTFYAFAGQLRRFLGSVAGR